MPMYMATHPTKPHMDPTEAAQMVYAVFTSMKLNTHWLRYWLSDGEGRMFCLWDAPSAEAVWDVLRAARIPTDGVFEVDEGDPALLRQGLETP